jgi:hypothetical protein
MVQLQDCILEHLHHHTFFNMLFDKISKAHRAWVLSCSTPRANVWLRTQPIFLTFQLSSPIFFHHTSYLTWITPSLNCMHPLMCVHTSHRPYGYLPLMLCVHDNKRIGTHDAIHDPFATIMRDINFHVGRKQLYALPSTTFNSSHQGVNIVFTKNDIPTCWSNVNKFISLILHNNLLPIMHLKQRNRVIATNTPLINSSP